MIHLKDFKKEVIQKHGVLDKAIFKFNEQENVIVQGNKSRGYEVWFTHFIDGRLTTKRMNPANSENICVPYKEIERAILKANRVIITARQNRYQ